MSLEVIYSTFQSYSSILAKGRRRNVTSFIHGARHGYRLYIRKESSLNKSRTVGMVVYHPYSDSCVQVSWCL